jgi:hypothetical protein
MENTDNTYKMTSRFYQHPEQHRSMVNPTIRLSVIELIDAGELYSETSTGQKEKWWTDKHHPNKEIPKNIYFLGDGSPNQLYDKYVTKFGNVIEKSEFLNYTRGLIKQNILL